MDLALAGPAIARRRDLPFPFFTCTVTGSAQLTQTATGIVEKASELVEPGFLGEDLRGKIAIGVHAASFCKADRRQERPLRSLKDVDG